MSQYVITGSGMVAGGLASAAAARGIEADVLPRGRLDVTDAVAVNRQICELRPGVIFHTAGLTRVNQCEQEPELAYNVNAGGTENIVQAARGCGSALVLFSTDYVFDGSKPEGWLETDSPAPLNVYGRSKLAAEELVLAYDLGYVVRTSGVFGRRFDGQPERNFFRAIVQQVTSSQDKIPVVSDQFTAVSYAPDLGKMVVEAFNKGAERILHVVCGGSDNWAGWAVKATGILGIDPDRIEPVPSKRQITGTMRPMHSVLKSNSRMVDEMSRRHPAVTGLLKYLKE